MTTRMRQTCRAIFLVALLGPRGVAQLTNLPAGVQTTIVEMGPGVDETMAIWTYALMRPLQAPRADLAVGHDVSYGEDPLQKLDLYAPHRRAAQPRPVVIFVHGGSFTSGDKGNG